MMTPEEAAICLRDDPTFASSSRLEQEEEAALILGTDDPLDIALAVEMALEAPREVRSASGNTPPRLRCRLETPCRAPRLAGNGRCMDCGAEGAIPDAPKSDMPLEAPAEPVESDLPPEAPKQPAKPRIIPATKAEAKRRQRAALRDPERTFIGRFKEACGTTDHELAAMIGKSRATVQAYALGRLPEILSREQIGTLADDLGERLILIAQLQRDLLASIGEVD